MDKPIKKNYYARFTTIRACLHELRMELSKEQIMDVGKIAADAYFDVFGNRPPKIEIVENGGVFHISSFPMKFKPIILNVLKQVKK